MFAPRYCSSIDESNVKLVVQVLQTLVEVCVVRSVHEKEYSLKQHLRS